MSHLIREWTPEDLPAVQHVLMTTWLDAYSRFIPEEDMRTYFQQHYGLQSLQALFHAPGVSGCVAEVDGMVVGVARLQFNFQERRFYVSSLYILPEYQGRGLGMELMRASEMHAVAYNDD